MVNDINFKNIGELIVNKQTISKVYCSNIQLWHGKEKFIRFKTRNSGALKLYKIPNIDSEKPGSLIVDGNLKPLTSANYLGGTAYIEYIYNSSANVKIREHFSLLGSNIQIYNVYIGKEDYNNSIKKVNEYLERIPEYKGRILENENTLLHNLYYVK